VWKLLLWLLSTVYAIRTKKKIKSYYNKFENEYKNDVDVLRDRFLKTISYIEKIFNGTLADSEFKRIHLFYSLFASFYHLEHGMPGINKQKRKLIKLNSVKVKISLERIENIFKAEDTSLLEKRESTFLTDSRRATTDESVRVRRTEYIIDIILQGA